MEKVLTLQEENELKEKMNLLFSGLGNSKSKEEIDKEYEELQYEVANVLVDSLIDRFSYITEDTIQSFDISLEKLTKGNRETTTHSFIDVHEHFLIAYQYAATTEYEKFGTLENAIGYLTKEVYKDRLEEQKVLQSERIGLLSDYIKNVRLKSESNLEFLRKEREEFEREQKESDERKKKINDILYKRT